MRIKTRIQLGIILSLVLAATIALLLFFTARAVSELTKLDGITAEVVKGVAELKIVSHEYILNPEERSLMQWRSKYRSLSKLLTGSHFKSPDEKIVVDQILNNLERFKTVFAAITTGLREGAAIDKQENETFRELQNRLKDELLIKSQLLVSFAFQLHQEIDAKSVATQKRASLLTLLLLFTLTAAIIGISLWVNRSIARPIAKLEKDIRIIGSGNLDHKVGATATDEIGQLSRAFDKMTEDLKETTTSIVELNKEIDERKEAETALRESEKRARQYLDISGVAFVALDNEGNITLINQRGLEILGYREKELLGKNWFKTCLPERMTDEVLDVYQQLIRGEIEPVEYYENPILTKDGQERILAWHNAVLRNPDSEIVGVLSSGEDITHRLLAEEALKRSEEKYRSMMEAMKDPIYICSQDYRVEYMNPAMIQRTGRDATGEDCFKAVHDLEEKCSWCKRHKVQQGECLESEIVSPKDNRSYHVSSSPIVHEDGSVSQVTVFRDTTDLKELEVQLQQAQKMEAIGTLAGGIAHDFNNILGGIMGYAELAKMKAPEESKVIADLDNVIRSSERAADLIKQILTISRRHKKEQKPVQVRYIVSEALKLLKATLPATIEIREDLARDAGIVNADPTQIHQVIMNLGTNAGHAMQDDGGVLEVTLANVEFDDLSASKHLDLTAGSYLRLTVSDTGHGMPPEIMERIFDPYFTTKDTGEGTGLGLSVAQGIVKAHRGTVTVYSELGKGTTFHVYLPLILEEEREEKESEGPLPTGSECILFIDDEQVLIEVGGQMLEQLGYEVVTKRSSVQALELFRAEPERFHLVITDMTMPHMTGDKLAQELMKIRPQIPIILCTGHSRLVSEEKAKEIGIKAFVMKPLVMRNLAETVRKILDAAQKLGTGKYIRKAYTLEKVGLAVKEELEK